MSSKLTLNHEVLDDTVEAATLEAKTLFTGAQGTEVLQAGQVTYATVVPFYPA